MKYAADLSTLDVDQLINLARQSPRDDSREMNEIVSRFTTRAKAIAMSLSANAAVQDDLMQAALLGLVRAVRRHHEERDGFLSYARAYMTGAAKRELARWHAQPHESLSDPAVMAEAEGIAAEASIPGLYTWGCGRLAERIATLPERQQLLLRQRYIDDATMTEIAAVAGVSVPAVSQRLATAHKAIRGMLAA